jgi:serine/threonine-protein kinase
VNAAPGAGAGRPDPVGTILAGRYRIVRLLGEGAMGAVYVGEHLKIGRHDAIKVLRGPMAFDAESIARFNRGARNLSAIRHPNVCTLYDYGETEDGSPFLAMEFVTGETLKDLITREHTLEPARALRIALQVADALDAAHDAGIVHRDLKPANIMIERGRDGSDVAKVVDFDIAKGPEPEGDEVTRLGFVVGTPEYMSPEQLTGERLDGRSDLYSLGIVLFRMLTGELPFRGASPQDIMVERLTQQPRTLADVAPARTWPPGLQAVLDRALARDRAQRVADAGDLARELRAVMAAQGIADIARAPVVSSTGRSSAAASAPPATLHPAASATGVSTAPGRPGDVLPGTVVTPPAQGPPATTTPNRNRRRIVSILATLVLLVAGGLLLPQMMPGRLQPESDGTDGGAQRGSGPGASAVQPDSAPRATDPRRGGSAPAESVRVPGNRGTNTADANTGSAKPTGNTGTGNPATAIHVASADAQDVLFRLLERFDTPASPETARAVRDTAEVIFAMAIPPVQRALAAYVQATAYQALHDASGCRTWINRALELRPDGPGYRDLLQSCGGGA